MSGDIGQWMDIALAPAIALTIALVNLFYEKENSRRKWLVYVLLAAAFAAFLVQVRVTYRDNQKAETQRAEAAAELKTLRENDTKNQLEIRELKTLLSKVSENQDKLPEQISERIAGTRQTPARATTLEGISRDVGGLLKTQQEAATEPVATQTITQQGWAYYGFQESEGPWVTQYFKRESGNRDELPKAGDIVVATTYVNARQGHIEFSDSSGWVNQPVIGKIKPYDRLEVLEVYPVLDSYIWIKFKRAA